MENKTLHHPLSLNLFRLHTFFLCFLLLCFHCNSSALDTNSLSNRQTLQSGIGIGIGGGSSPPSPESEPKPKYPLPPPPPATPSPPPKSPPQKSPPSPPLPTPKPPPSPQRNPPSRQPKKPKLTPRDFPNLLQYRAYLVIRRFKRTIYSDPQSITKTWRGSDLRKYKGFYLETPPRYKNNTPTVASVDFNGYRLGSHTISGFIDGLPDLALFHANTNKLGGKVPDLTKLPYLYELDLSNNIFTGPIPTFIGEASNTLTEVRFLGNRLSGCLPAEIGRLRMATVLDAGFNEISGPIPRALGCLRKVEQLNFAGNLLYGEVPEEVCRLGIDVGGRLLNLSLSDNYFTSVGKSCLKLLQRGNLHINKNCIRGFRDQRSPEECARFFPRRQYCPSLSYVPCYYERENGGDGGSSGLGGAVPVSVDGFSSYPALGKNNGP